MDQVADLNFENSDNLTFLLAEDLNPAVNTGDWFGGGAPDLDAADDGFIDFTGDGDGDTIDDGAPWTELLECVALIETPDAGDLVYCDAIRVGPDGTFVPGHVFFCEDSAWQIGSFSGGDDTPDAMNSCPTPVQESTWGRIKSQYRTSED